MTLTELQTDLQTLLTDLLAGLGTATIQTQAIASSPLLMRCGVQVMAPDEKTPVDRAQVMQALTDKPAMYAALNKTWPVNVHLTWNPKSVCESADGVSVLIDFKIFSQVTTPPTFTPAVPVAAPVLVTPTPTVKTPAS